MVGRDVGIEIACCVVDINSSRNLARLWSRVGRAVSEVQHERAPRTAHHVMEGFSKRAPLPLHRQIPPGHTAASRCLSTLRVPGALTTHVTSCSSRVPNQTRRSTPTSPTQSYRRATPETVPLSRRNSFLQPQLYKGLHYMTAFTASSRCRRTQVGSSMPLLSAGSAVDSLRRKRPTFHAFWPLAARQRSCRVASNVPQIRTQSAF